MGETSWDANGNLLGSWLDFRELMESHPEIREMLFDSVTGLPTTPLLFPRIRMLLEERGEVSLLAINVVRYSRIEEIYGWKVFDEVMREVAGSLEAITGRVLRDSDIVAELMIAGNSFVVVLSPPRNSVKIDPDARQMIVQKVEKGIREHLAGSIDPALYRKFGCYVGAATVAWDRNARLERIIHKGLDMALGETSTREAADASERRQRLEEIIKREQVTTLVHPVVDLADLAVIGYEALSRGPEDTEFEHPDKLFTVAYDGDLVVQLERLCRMRALEAASRLPSNRLFFVNIEPEAVSDPQLREAITTDLLSQSGISPGQIVLEITERNAIVDFAAFRASLKYLRALGFQVAVDDAGAGYGSLQCLAEVNPDWLKIDLSLVRGCDADEVRAQLIGSLVTFSERIGVGLVAEGIETAAELQTLRDLGVQYGQGFLFSLPLEPFPSDDELVGLHGL